MMDIIQVDELLNKFKELKSKLSKIIVDKDLSLDQRWKYYEKAGSLLPVDSYYFNPKAKGLNWNTMSLYDDFYCEKFSTMTGVEFVDLCIDINTQRKEVEKIDILEVKEYWLNSGCYAFINNW
jgi:hypothetical protein